MKRNFRDNSGAVSLYAALALPVLVGIVGLALDSNNLFTMDADLQHAADAAALAGAAELDGATDASTRAISAAQTAVANTSVMSTVHAISIPAANVLFYSANCTGSALTGTAAQISRSASCIKVTTENKTLVKYLIQAVGFTGAINNKNRSAMATSTYSTCRPTPLLICESGTVNLNGASEGKQYQLTTPGTNSGALFGRLLPPPGSGIPSSSGGHDAETYLGWPGGGTCYSNSIIPDTGNANGTTQKGVNTRLDIYPSGNANPNLSTFPPAPQSLGGLKECTGNQTTSTRASFPQDQSFNGWAGNGVWDRVGYKNLVHTQAGDVVAPLLCATCTITRFKTYLAELGISETQAETAGFTAASITNLKTVVKSFPSDSGSGSNLDHAAPSCFGGGASTVYPASRRIIYVAVSNNCGSSIPASGLVVSRYAKFFLTEATQNDVVWAEFIRWETASGNGGTGGNSFHHTVQLVK